MRIVSWNVAGWRACVNKGFTKSMSEFDPDIIALQETKVTLDQIDFRVDSYQMYLNPAEKRGYSGTALLTKPTPISTSFCPASGNEGRLIAAEYPDFYLVNVYSPNSQKYLQRLSYRLQFEEFLYKVISILSSRKPIIMCGDFNVAHQPIDLKHPDNNAGYPGYSSEERNAFSRLLSLGFIDIYRHLYPDKVNYSFWTYFGDARQNNSGWRLDYFVISEVLVSRVKNIFYDRFIIGSDHCPVVFDIDI